MDQPNVVACPSCGKQFRLSSEHWGKQLRCKECNHVFSLHAPGGDPPPREPPVGTSQPVSVGAGRVVRISKRFFDVSFVLVGISSIIQLLLLALAPIRYAIDLVAFPYYVLVWIIGVPTVLYGTVLMYIVLFKMWAALQPWGLARTSPGKAVGFCFIPFWNFYWVFQAYWGWTKDYNRTISRHRVSARPVPEGLALTCCVLMLVLAILIPLPPEYTYYYGSPGGHSTLRGVLTLKSLAHATWPILPILLMLLLRKACAAINALADAREQR